MPVYEVQLRGEASARIVRASSAAKARDHVVTAKALNAEELADALETGAKIETATEADEPGQEPAKPTDAITAKDASADKATAKAA